MPCIDYATRSYGHQDIRNCILIIADNCIPTDLQQLCPTMLAKPAVFIFLGGFPWCDMYPTSSGNSLAMLVTVSPEAKQSYRAPGAPEPQRGAVSSVDMVNLMILCPMLEVVLWGYVQMFSNFQMGCVYSQSYNIHLECWSMGLKWTGWLSGVMFGEWFGRMFHSGSFRLTFSWWMTLQFFVYDEATQVILAGNAVHFLGNPRCRNDYMWGKVYANRFMYIDVDVRWSIS